MASKSLNTLRKISYTRTRRCFCNAGSREQITTAAIIVVGDEILKGYVADTNSTYLAKELHRLGLKLKKISVIGDCVNEVCNEVKQFSDQYDYVITSGGIGPTHDDITFEAVGKAFNSPLVLNPELKALCKSFYKTSREDYPGLKLAYIPKSAKLNYPKTSGVNYPNVSINNVYMFPGIPELLKNSFNGLGEHLFKSNKKFYTQCVYCNATEDKIVEILNALVREFPTVEFGSYPKLFHKEYKVKLTMESLDESATMKAHDKLIELLPKEFIVNIKE